MAKVAERSEEPERNNRCRMTKKRRRAEKKRGTLKEETYQEERCATDAFWGKGKDNLGQTTVITKMAKAKMRPKSGMASARGDGGWSFKAATLLQPGTRGQRL